MKQIAVISGKGGAGKTSIIAAFAGLARNAVMADCDVDAADLRLILTPHSARRRPEPFRAGYEMVVDEPLCIGCGLCAELCRFDAITMELVSESPRRNLPRIDPFACEGCGLCAQACPEEAIGMRRKNCGRLFLDNTRFGPLVHAKLIPGEGNSGKLVASVRERAKELAQRDDRDMILIDGSPGIGCPVIASVTGVDAVVLVSEPTVSGIHDLKRAAELTRHFQIPSFLVINKSDINPQLADQMVEESRALDLSTLGAVPFDPAFVQAMLAHQTIVEYDDRCEAAQRIVGIWERLLHGI